ncbi:hypothetical protein TIFTF001_055336 [Ficus carica]|uniref:Uncharacterized protein n=1 Tax=Ficus carica TaxID=3494 RepID=A0AA88JE20_FICCA|nr:hypothetical protein TIFTF001_055335 [Ficus carica]GMN73398.1 hypothetical protein TIFTF001_055336 [Ficus carica]
MPGSQPNGKDIAGVDLKGNNNGSKTDRGGSQSTAKDIFAPASKKK